MDSTPVRNTVLPVVDLGNLLVEDLMPIEQDEFEADPEKYLLDRFRDNVQALVQKLWELPNERVEDAIVVQLPEATTILPRAKPIPQPRLPTKWEQFARMKGIKKRKKSRLVWDEVAKEWKPSWGYRRTKNPKDDWLVPVPDQKDPYEDYLGKKAETKKEAIARNELQRLRNIKRRVGTSDTPVSNFMPPQKSVDEISRQIETAKKATASLGRFTEALPDEKPPRNSGRKRKFDTNFENIAKEKEHQLELLKRLDVHKPKLNVEKAVKIHETEEMRQNREKKQIPGNSPRAKKKGTKGKKVIKRRPVNGKSMKKAGKGKRKK